MNSISWIWNNPNLVQCILQNFYMKDIFSLARVNRCFCKQAKNPHTHDFFKMGIYLPGDDGTLFVSQSNFREDFPLQNALIGYKEILRIKLKWVCFCYHDEEYNTIDFTNSFLDCTSQLEKLFLLKNLFPNLLSIENIESFAVFECEELICLFKQIKYYFGWSEIIFGPSLFLPNLRMILGEHINNFPKGLYVPNLKVVYLSSESDLSVIPKFPSIEAIFVTLEPYDYKESEILEMNSVKVIWINTYEDVEYEKLEEKKKFFNTCHRLIRQCPNLKHFVYDPNKQPELLDVGFWFWHQYTHVNFIRDNRGYKDHNDPQIIWNAVEDIYPELK